MTKQRNTLGRMNDDTLCDRCDVLMKQITEYRQRGWTCKAQTACEQLLDACGELGRRIEREQEQASN